jgi:hypothetical protein
VTKPKRKLAERVKESADRLRKHLEIAVHPRSFSIGIADSELHVYLHKRLYKKIVPDDWEGYPVQTIYVGQVRPA